MHRAVSAAMNIDEGPWEAQPPAVKQHLSGWLTDAHGSVHALGGLKGAA
jgi:hypothetical protein